MRQMGGNPAYIELLKLVDRLISRPSRLPKDIHTIAQAIE
jgi:hypothetical protein